MSDGKTIEFGTRSSELEFSANADRVFVTIDKDSGEMTHVLTMEQARELHKWLGERVKELEL